MTASTNTSQRDSGSIVRVVIPTRDRPKVLQRTIETLLQSNSNNRMELAILVIDASTSGRAAPITGLSNNLKERAPSATIICIDLDGIDRLVERLAHRARLPMELIRFALCGSEGYSTNTGASRNIGMLATRGDRVLFLDDDIVCQLYNYAERFDTRPDINTIVPLSRFFASRSALLDALVPSMVSVLDAHEFCLGRQVKECNWSPPGGSTMERHPYAEMRIRASVMGVAGSITNPSPAQAFYRFMASKFAAGIDNYHAQELLRAGEVARGAATFELGRGVLTSGYCLGLENTELLPPWLPVLRSQDLIFGTTMNICVPEAIGCHLPWMVLHDRADPYRFTEQLVAERFCEISWGELISQVIGHIGRAHRMVVLNPVLLGSFVCEVANMDINLLRQHVLEIAETLRARRLSLLEETLALDRDMPVFVRDEVARTIVVLKMRIRTEKLECLERRFTSRDAILEFRQLLINFGDLLQSWSIIAAAFPEAWVDAGYPRGFVREVE